MTITKHGIKAPVNAEELYGVRSVYNEVTGMSGTLYATEWPYDTLAGVGFYLATEHEDVGLVTWFEAPSFEEANHFLDRLKDVETCSVPGDNHSEDLISVHSGTPNAVVLCGYHEAKRHA